MVFEEFNGEDELFEFAEDGTFDSEHDLDGSIHPFGIAVDDEDNVYYIGNQELAMRYNGSFSREISGLTEGEYGEKINKSGLTVDPNSGDLYLDIERESIARFSFDSSGKP